MSRTVGTRFISQGASRLFEGPPQPKENPWQLIRIHWWALSRWNPGSEETFDVLFRLSTEDLVGVRSEPAHRRTIVFCQDELPDPPLERLRFPLGDVSITSGVLELARRMPLNIESHLTRHENGDWGDVDEKRWRANDEAVTTPETVHSVYDLSQRHRLWIITGKKRVVTTILLPHEY